MKPARTHYSPLSIGLHWLFALALPATFAMGVYMTDLPFSPAKLQYYSWHKWAGVSLFLLAVLRLSWRLWYGAPSVPAGLPRWQQIAATATHHLLYLLMFAIPLSGWLMSSAKGVPTVWFGVLPLPDLLSRNVELGQSLGFVHGSLNLVLVALVLMHVGAALKHHLIDRDEVLARMLPFLRRSPD